MRVYTKRRKAFIGRGSNSPQPSPAAEIVASNVDLLTEILLRSPAKSLVRFKCVSKHWLSLISDSHFASSHARRRRNPPISALYYYTGHVVPQPDSVSLHGGDHHHHHPTLPFLNRVGGAEVARISHSCNGLILCEYNHFDRSSLTIITHYIVCNPTTQNYRRIPDQLDGQSMFICASACLAFDPSKSPHYKVVLLHYNRVNIYSSESGSWKQIGAPGGPPPWLGRAVFWDGAVHWLSDHGVSFRFEVDAEKMITMQYPPRPKILPPDNIRYFGECGGRLVLIQTRLPSAMGFRILEMDMDCCRWIVKCRVNLRLMSRVCEFDKFSMLFVVKGEEGKDFELVLAMRGKVFSYDLKCKTWKLLRDMAGGRSTTTFIEPNAYPYIASLSPV